MLSVVWHELLQDCLGRSKMLSALWTLKTRPHCPLVWELVCTRWEGLGERLRFCPASYSRREVF